MLVRCTFSQYNSSNIKHSRVHLHLGSYFTSHHTDSVKPGLGAHGFGPSFLGFRKLNLMKKADQDRSCVDITV